MFKKSRRKKEVVLLLENIQYAVNVASMFRTADAAGVKKIVLSGISHKPPFGKDLSKTSRAKERSVDWHYLESTTKAVKDLKKEGYYLVGVELTSESQDISQLSYIISDKDKVCFVLGSEVYGVKEETLSYCNAVVFIPMFGKGASLNVSVSAGIVLYSF
jgi:tRNA G18 (ribose-2'-O)-methylase SpoU